MLTAEKKAWKVNTISALLQPPTLDPLCLLRKLETMTVVSCRMYSEWCVATEGICFSVNHEEMYVKSGGHLCNLRMALCCRNEDNDDIHKEMLGLEMREKFELHLSGNGRVWCVHFRNVIHSYSVCVWFCVWNIIWEVLKETGREMERESGLRKNGKVLMSCGSSTTLSVRLGIHHDLHVVTMMLILGVS